MHIETAFITAPAAIAAWAYASGGLSKAIREPRRSALKPLVYGLGALLCAELGHHGGGRMDTLAHLAGGLCLWMSLLELSTWLPRPARAHS